MRARLYNLFEWQWSDIICLFILLMVLNQSAFAQPITVQGNVVSETEKETLIGVTVAEQDGSGLGVTDVDGNYTIQCDRNATLVFSYVGFKTQSVDVANRAFVNVVMVSDLNILEGMVVTGYKSEIKSNVTSAISSIKSKDIEKLSVIGLDQALQGQAPGVQVTQTSGAPGDNIVVRIRGVGTFGDNDPLYVVDGVPTTENINMFSTNDIESIEVLKDGASAAIYGSRAANGVILITTKRGKAGLPSFSFNSSVGVDEVRRLPKLLNSSDYVRVRNEAIKNANTLREPIRQVDTIPLNVLDTLPDIDWLDEVFNPAIRQRYTLSASGGSDHSKYYIMGEYLKQEGTFRGQSFDKYGVRFNGETGNHWFKVGQNISFSVTDRDVINSTGDGYGPGNELNALRYALIAAPVFPIYKSDGSYYNVSSELGNPILFGDGNANPLAIVDATTWKLNRSRIFGNIFAELKPWEPLTLRTTLGGDFQFENEKKFKERLSAAIYNPTSLSEGRVFSRNLVWNNTMDFQKRFGQHRFSALVGMEAIQNRVNYLGASTNNFFRTDELFQNIDNSIIEDISNVGISGITAEWALLSYFGQANYSFGNRYVVGASLRRDGSSRFGIDNRWGYFPSFSAGWNISNESFFKSIPLISTLKIRGSWGQLGNQEIGTYPYSSLVSTGTRVYTFGGNVVTGAQVLATGNANIRWEESTQYDFGLDLGLFKDRLSIILDYFNKTSEGVLLPVPIPQSGGEQDPPIVNAASIENKGIELAVNFNNRSGEFNYSIGGNISFLRNKVLSLSDGEPIYGGFGLSDGPITLTEVGRPVGSFYLYEAVGLFQTMEEIEASPYQSDFTRPGDVKFADLNGDDVIDSKDRAHLGSPFPDFSYGVNFSLDWKNFDLSALVQGVQGNDIYFLYGNFAYETQARGFNAYEDILDYWSPTNTDATIPKVSIDDRNGNRRISNRFLYDGSYLKLRNVSLGYNFSGLIKTKYIAGLRAYVTGQNLLTFTKYPGLDPEIQANTNDVLGSGLTSDLAVGIDWGTVPAPRTILFGITLDF